MGSEVTKNSVFRAELCQNGSKRWGTPPKNDQFLIKKRPVYHREVELLGGSPKPNFTMVYWTFFDQKLIDFWDPPKKWSIFDQKTSSYHREVELLGGSPKRIPKTNFTMARPFFFIKNSSIFGTPPQKMINFWSKNVQLPSWSWIFRGVPKTNFTKANSISFVCRHRSSAASSWSHCRSFL